jgi:hypothetical protein
MAVLGVQRALSWTDAQLTGILNAHSHFVGGLLRRDSKPGFGT